MYNKERVPLCLVAVPSSHIHWASLASPSKDLSVSKPGHTWKIRVLCKPTRPPDLVSPPRTPIGLSECLGLATDPALACVLVNLGWYVLEAGSN
jgi:hypothetical protein